MERAAEAPAVMTQGLTKRYSTAVAVDALNLTVPAGSVFGFLGPNGAGKTTTIRMLMGLARPTAGQALIFGEPAGPNSPVKRRIGFLPDVPAFYGWMRAPEYLEFAGGLFGMGGSALKKRVGELLEFTGLAGVKTRVGGFSRGMKQRLGLAQALVNDPDLVILDEPTSALDPIGRREVLDAIKALGQNTAATVFFSTHILADVERVCERVAILDRGRLVADETLKDLKARYTRPIFLVTLGSGLDQAQQAAADLAKEMRGLDWVEQVDQAEAEGGAATAGGAAVAGQGAVLRVTARDSDAAQRAIPKLVSERGLPLARFETAEPTLEDVFMRVVNRR